jgi:hypothetical protein
MITPLKSISGTTSPIWAISTRGKTKGQTLVPHKNQRGPHAGFYIVSPSKFKQDYLPVRDPDDLKKYVKDGYYVRMSLGAGKSPNLFAPASIEGWR